MLINAQARDFIVFPFGRLHFGHAFCSALSKTNAAFRLDVAFYTFSLVCVKPQILAHYLAPKIGAPKYHWLFIFCF